MRRRVFHWLVAALGSAGAGTPLLAQWGSAEHRDASIAEVAAGNAIAGALTAALRALRSGKPVPQAAVLGALGGSMHFSGKLMASRGGSLAEIGAIGVGALASSIVANAGRGVAPFSELFLPIGPLRIRARLDSTRSVSFSLNAYEAIVLATYASHRDLRYDHSLTIASGAPVFVTRRLPIVNGVDTDGVTSGAAIVMSEFARDPELTLRHELVHVHQQRFIAETWSRPIEGALRSSVPMLRWIPSWIDLGFFGPSLVSAERAAFGRMRGPYARLLESEADWFDRRNWQPR
jgi:hypothetical protein